MFTHNLEFWWIQVPVWEKNICLEAYSSFPKEDSKHDIVEEIIKPTETENIYNEISVIPLLG